eukprot:Hpha_TRINITY_DN15307_c5_g2::TRINITY_DN15307_c5_g2_i1::g.92230::m.92230
MERHRELVSECSSELMGEYGSGRGCSELPQIQWLLPVVDEPPPYRRKWHRSQVFEYPPPPPKQVPYQFRTVRCDPGHLVAPVGGVVNEVANGKGTGVEERSPRGEGHGSGGVKDTNDGIELRGEQLHALRARLRGIRERRKEVGPVEIGRRSDEAGASPAPARSPPQELGTPSPPRPESAQGPTQGRGQLPAAGAGSPRPSAVVESAVTIVAEAPCVEIPAAAAESSRPSADAGSPFVPKPAAVTESPVAAVESPLEPTPAAESPRMSPAAESPLAPTPATASESPHTPGGPAPAGARRRWWKEARKEKGAPKRNSALCIEGAPALVEPAPSIPRAEFALIKTCPQRDAASGNVKQWCERAQRLCNRVMEITITTSPPIHCEAGGTFRVREEMKVKGKSLGQVGGVGPSPDHAYLGALIVALQRALPKDPPELCRVVSQKPEILKFWKSAATLSSLFLNRLQKDLDRLQYEPAERGWVAR